MPYSKEHYKLFSQGRLDEAIGEVTERIRCEKNEPCNYFNRGRYFLEKGDVQKAVVDLENVLRISDEFSFSYYDELTHFLLAYCYILSEDGSAAKEHLELTRTDLNIPISGKLRSRSELMKCAELL